MAEDNELEKRAIEELLKETDRARMRAETMGPTGWLKCPLQSTNKRFLLNTLRPTGTQKHTAETVDDPAASRRRSRSNSLDRKRDRSRSPFRDHTSKGGNTDHKHHQRDSCNNKDKRRDGDRERSYRHKDNREWRHGRDKAKD
ncbi:protein POLR1D-like [Takifugu flavidus]|uniref:protein POLR1D-like n=1 Tax=Takifugu flavidus TaxID=433684 RepID=UPI0025445DF0|nr:protein POLR1D-like [Takifugu flavidus]